MVDSILVEIAMTFLFLLLFNVIYGDTIDEKHDRKFAFFVILSYYSFFTAACTYAMNGIPQYSNILFVSMTLSVFMPSVIF